MNSNKIFALSTFSILACGIFSSAWAGPVNINTATAEQLDQELKGVGPVVAQRIVEHRESQGRFSQASELVLVKGVGDKTLSKNASFILIE